MVADLRELLQRLADLRNTQAAETSPTRREELLKAIKETQKKILDRLDEKR